MLSKKKTEILILCLIAIGAFIVVCILNIIVPAQNDLDDFRRWGNSILNNGLSSFYEKDPNVNHDAPTDYPPIYPLICAGIAWLCKLLNASIKLESFFFRLPSAFILVVSIFVFYFLAKHFIRQIKKSLTITAIFAFAPATIADIVWGSN